ncbi:C2 domain protein [Ancylostoma duodenale]|uniref:C2 domain protein n=1 Tax=Ancylostoma duodenale TaxID=51022 RepID=A0A0C2D7Z7_9BILA|nr:C2 domain protein [Ancylostoma duodenale]
MKHSNRFNFPHYMHLLPLVFHCFTGQLSQTLNPHCFAIFFCPHTHTSTVQAGLSPSMHRVSNGSVASGDSRRNSMVDACGRFCSQPTNGAPELLIALCYDTDHGCLTVGIERGSSLGEKSRPPDTFIKIVALGEFGNELWRQKTELVKGSAEPQYDHSASIQLHRPDLDVCTVRIEVWSSVGVLRRRQLLGWLALGLNSSSPDAQEHWEQMIQVSRRGFFSLF